VPVARGGPPSMREPLSRPEQDDYGTSQTSIRRHPLSRGAMRPYAVAPIHTGGVVVRHGGPGCNLSPALDLDVGLLQPLSATTPDQGGAKGRTLALAGQRRQRRCTAACACTGFILHIKYQRAPPVCRGTASLSSFPGASADGQQAIAEKCPRNRHPVQRGLVCATEWRVGGVASRPPFLTVARLDKCDKHRSILRLDSSASVPYHVRR
jgi:hypothetical protein